MRPRFVLTSLLSLPVALTLCATAAVAATPGPLRSARPVALGGKSALLATTDATVSAVTAEGNPVAQASCTPAGTYRLLLAPGAFAPTVAANVAPTAGVADVRVSLWQADGASLGGWLGSVSRDGQVVLWPEKTALALQLTGTAIAQVPGKGWSGVTLRADGAGVAAIAGGKLEIRAPLAADGTGGGVLLAVALGVQETLREWNCPMQGLSNQPQEVKLIAWAQVLQGTGKTAKLKTVALAEQKWNDVIAPWADGASSVASMAIVGDAKARIAYREVKELADILKADYGVAGPGELVIQSDGWSATGALPTHALVALDNGQSVVLPANSYQQNYTCSLDFDGDPSGYTYTFTLADGTPVTLVAGDNRGSCHYGRCFCVEGRADTGWRLQVSQYAGSAASFPADVAIGLPQALANDKPAPRALKLDCPAPTARSQSVSVVFAGVAGFSANPYGLDLTGRVSLLAAPDARGKQAVLAKGTFFGQMTLDAAGQPQLAATGIRPVQSRADLLTVAEAVPTERAGTSLAPPVLASATISGVASSRIGALDPNVPIGLVVLPGNASAHHTDGVKGGPEFPSIQVPVLLRRAQTVEAQLSVRKRPGEAMPDFSQFGVLATSSAGTMWLELTPKGGTYLAKDGMGYTVALQDVVIQLSRRMAVGRWNLALIKYDNAFLAGETNCAVLFNPYVPGQPESVPAEATYALVESELEAFAEPDDSSLYRLWSIDQRDAGVVVEALDVADALSAADRQDPLQFASAVAKQASAGRWGRWDGTYKDGSQPGTWSGTAQLLATDPRKRSAKYGQCMIFSAVTTSLLRAAGVPSRPVTNISSAHARWVGSYVIKASGALDAKGVPATPTTGYDFVQEAGGELRAGAGETQPGPNRGFATLGDIAAKAMGGSTWSFHVWTEVWQAPGAADPKTGEWLRQDDNQTPAGWNALDATPQEASVAGPAAPSLSGLPGKADALTNFHVWTGAEWLQVAPTPVIPVDAAFVAADPTLEAAALLAGAWSKSVAAQIEAQLAACDRLGDGYRSICRSNVSRMYSKSGS